MSTYAQWVLWVGLNEEYIPVDGLPEKAQAFLNTIREAKKPRKYTGLVIESITMHGEMVGIGVVIHELGWETELQSQNVFDLSIVNRAQEVQRQLNALFDTYDLFLRATIFHHLDLGE